MIRFLRTRNKHKPVGHIGKISPEIGYGSKRRLEGNPTAGDQAAEFGDERALRAFDLRHRNCRIDPIRCRTVAAAIGRPLGIDRRKLLRSLLDMRKIDDGADFHAHVAGAEHRSQQVKQAFAAGVFESKPLARRCAGRVRYDGRREADQKCKRSRTHSRVNSGQLLSRRHASRFQHGGLIIRGRGGSVKDRNPGALTLAKREC